MAIGRTNEGCVVSNGTLLAANAKAPKAAASRAQVAPTSQESGASYSAADNPVEVPSERSRRPSCMWYNERNYVTGSSAEVVGKAPKSTDTPKEPASRPVSEQPVIPRSSGCRLVL